MLGRKVKIVVLFVSVVLANSVIAKQAPQHSSPKPQVQTEQKKETINAGTPTSTAQDKASGATAKCRDGSLSYSTHHKGTCSHHKGVAVWYK